jgi:hypothetical protein
VTYLRFSRSGGSPRYTSGRHGDRLQVLLGLQCRTRLQLGLLLRVRLQFGPIRIRVELNTTEELLSGPIAGLVITSTPADRFVYWPDRKPADLTDDNSRCITYLKTLPFQEGTSLAPNEDENTPNEVATTDSSLCTPDRKVFTATGDAGTSEDRPDRYLDDISEDELSANAPPNKTTEDKNARRDRNRKRNDRRRRLREALPIRNLNETPDQVANRVHTTPEQCLMSITTIAR